MASHLQVFAVNAPLDIRHTYLSRSTGQEVKLPNLAGWLGLRQGGLNTDEIELFPLQDLADMPLSGYVATAFDISDDPLGQTAARLNALGGHVLLVPDAAIAGQVTTGAELTLIASLPMARADHSAQALQPTPPDPIAQPEPAPKPVPAPPKQNYSAALIAFVLAFVLVLVANIFW